jgi:predicted transposase YbfD/YdcC
MTTTTLSATLSLPKEGWVFDLNALYKTLQSVADQRDRRGRRYALADLLMIAVLAKLAGQDSSRAIAHWAKLRHQELSTLFQLQRQTMPHYSTWSRVLGYAVDPVQLEQVLGQFFATDVVKSAQPKRGSLALCIDGKTLRGTIPLGESRGVQLLAAYVPEQGIVLAQVRVEQTTNELGSAPHLLDLLDLRGVVVSGDALFDQRDLSVRIVQAGGDYVWTTKDNQADLREEIETLFQPQQARPGWSLPPTDFRTAISVNKGHGRLEQRTLTTSSMLAQYSSWPALAQVFKLESQTTNALGHTQGEVRYGLTSLPAWMVTPKQLLDLVRGHWRIEIV